ncbi:hypothetical protein ACIQF6_20010 [Kitasatospora sp. NPDC092948]|uniref:hypothetical protein n=1 Tax=Kitasatospora sp. NPDC092948 TaxID=3364088 RepID=UPI0038111A0B
MICPHCQVDLLQRNRASHTCGSCRRTFALDPKVEPGRLHDLKFRALVAKSTPDGLRITVKQLYWINERRLHRFPSREERAGSDLGGAVLVLVAVITCSLAVGIGTFAWFLFGPPTVIAALLAVQQFVRARRLRADVPLRPQVAFRDFERRVIGRWREVYHELPAGLVEHPPNDSGPMTVEARAVVLCELPSVASFLRINGFAERHQVLLVEELTQIPAELPVVVLRDLSLSALARTVTVRTALPGRRVVDGGLTPRAVFAPAKAVRLRDSAGPQRQVPAALAASTGWRRLTEQERDWLTTGWYSPLLTMPPPKLYALAEKAVQRAVTAPTAPTPPAIPPVETPERTRRRAERIGFLTWPQAVADPTADPAQAPTADAPSARPAGGAR